MVSKTSQMTLQEFFFLEGKIGYSRQDENTVRIDHTTANKCVLEH